MLLPFWEPNLKIKVKGYITTDQHFATKNDEKSIPGLSENWGGIFLTPNILNSTQSHIFNRFLGMITKLTVFVSIKVCLYTLKLKIVSCCFAREFSHKKKYSV